MIMIITQDDIQDIKKMSIDLAKEYLFNIFCEEANNMSNCQALGINNFNIFGEFVKLKN
jgi:hypothetical protein